MTKKVGLVVLLASISCVTHAANFNYNYGQIDYLSGDFDGFGISGSFVINNELFVRADYVGVTNDNPIFDVDYSQISFGAGYHMPIQPETDAVFTVSIVDADHDPGQDDTGLLLTASVRHNLAHKIEVSGGAHYINVFDDDFGLHAEVRYAIDEKMSAGLGYISADDNLDRLSLNFRVGF